MKVKKLDHLNIRSERVADLALPEFSIEVPQMSLRQLFVQDPNGVALELNFR